MFHELIVDNTTDIALPHLSAVSIHKVAHLSVRNRGFRPADCLRVTARRALSPRFDLITA